VTKAAWLGWADPEEPTNPTKETGRTLPGAIVRDYRLQTTEVRQTSIFRKRLNGLADRRAAERIAQIVRSQAGLTDDARPVGGGVLELRVDYGPGYRVTFVQRGAVPIILLCGGDKRSQSRDIVGARTLAGELEDE
jgi:putative addiction module killer protein